jgi:hypothetical protein
MGRLLGYQTMSHRYGHGKPAHAELEKLLQQSTNVYGGWLTQIGEYDGDYKAIMAKEAQINPDFYNGATPCWDCAAIHTMVCELRPKRWLEVGSGHSTAFAMNASFMHYTETEFEVVDPEAQPWLANFPVKVNPVGVNDVPVEKFTGLAAGDVLFVDGSHLANSGSDVVVLFLKILPQLRSGVWVHFHDIFLPYDYPPAWGGRREEQYSEQYMLALMLLMDGAKRYQVELPMHYSLGRGEFKEQVDQLNRVWTLGRKPEAGPQTRWDLSGASFWMRVK